MNFNCSEKICRIIKVYAKIQSEIITSNLIVVNFSCFNIQRRTKFCPQQNQKHSAKELLSNENPVGLMYNIFYIQKKDRNKIEIGYMVKHSFLQHKVKLIL